MARKKYFDITQVEGITPEIIKEYKKLVRHERYIEECDRMHNVISYGSEEEIERFLPQHISEDSGNFSADIIEQLYNALNKLYAADKLCYCAVMDYYFNCNNSSYSILAKKYGVSKQTIHNRIHKAILFLRKAMILIE